MKTKNQSKPENISVGRESCELPSTLMDVTSWNRISLTTT